jgi:hypothetical protein
MRRGCEQGVRRSHFYNLTQVHHRHPAADMPNQPEIVGDEQVRELQPLLQIHQQVDHLRLDRHVQRGDRLVRDHERGVQRERSREADALPLTAAELVWVAGELRRIEANQVEQFRDARPPGCLVTNSVNDQRFLHDVADAHPRVQGRIGILKNDLHVAPRLPEPGSGVAQYVLASEAHLAGRWFDEPQNAPSSRGLAAAGFSDESERFSLVDREAHTIDGPHNRPGGEQAS